MRIIKQYFKVHSHTFTLIYAAVPLLFVCFFTFSQAHICHQLKLLAQGAKANLHFKMMSRIRSRLWLMDDQDDVYEIDLDEKRIADALRRLGSETLSFVNAIGTGNISHSGNPDHYNDYELELRPAKEGETTDPKAMVWDIPVHKWYNHPWLALPEHYLSETRGSLKKLIIFEQSNNANKESEREEWSRRRPRRDGANFKESESNHAHTTTTTTAELKAIDVIWKHYYFENGQHILVENRSNKIEFIDDGAIEQRKRHRSKAKSNVEAEFRDYSVIGGDDRQTGNADFWLHFDNYNWINAKIAFSKIFMRRRVIMELMDWVDFRHAIKSRQTGPNAMYLETDIFRRSVRFRNVSSTPSIGSPTRDLVAHLPIGFSDRRKVFLFIQLTRQVIIFDLPPATSNAFQKSIPIRTKPWSTFLRCHDQPVEPLSDDADYDPGRQKDYIYNAQLGYDTSLADSLMWAVLASYFLAFVCVGCGLCCLFLFCGNCKFGQGLKRKPANYIISPTRPKLDTTKTSTTTAKTGKNTTSYAQNSFCTVSSSIGSSDSYAANRYCAVSLSNNNMGSLPSVSICSDMSNQSFGFVTSTSDSEKSPKLSTEKTAKTKTTNFAS